MTRRFITVVCCVISNAFAEPAATPPGMVWIAGGEFAMGSDALGSRADEKPVVNVRVDGFWIDAHPVTNEEFRKFVAATGYKTTAENPSIGNKSNASSRADPSSAAPNTAKATARAPAADPPPTPA